MKKFLTFKQALFSIAVLCALYQSAGATTCPNAINVPTIPVSNQALVCGAGNDLNGTSVPATCGGASNSYKGGNEALYTYTATTTGNHDISISGVDWTSIFVYAGCPTSGGTCVGSIGSAATSKSLTVSLTSGIQYFIWFDTWPSPISPCPGTFSINLSPAGPANDDCSGALSLTVGSSCSPVNGTTVSATQSIAPILCGFTATTALDVWYKFTATAAALNVTVVGGTDFDAVIDVRSGACNGTNIGCADATINAATEVAALTGLTIGNVYYVRVYDYTGTGTFTICVASPPPAPANDLCANAIAIPCGGSVNGTTVAATVDAGTVCGAFPPFGTSPGVWYTFTGTGYSTTLSLCSGAEEFDSYISVYTGSCGAFTCVAGDDDGCGSFADRSEVTFNAANGTVYYVLIRGYSSSDVETFTLTSQTTCLACNPVDPAVVSNLTSTGATLTWAPGAESYGYTNGAGLLGCPSNATVTNTSSSSVNLTGLTPGTDYTFCVRINTCTGGNAPSGWSSVRFTTPGGSCETPGALLVTNRTSTGATITWAAVAGATSYKWSRGTSSSCPNGTETTTATNTVTLTGLTPGRIYYFCVRSDCGGTLSSFRSVRFSTLAAPGARPESSFGDDLIDFSVYPNPANEDINLALNNFSAGENVNVQIINQLGQTMVSHRFISASEHVETIKVDQLPDGIYIMSVQSEGQEQKFKKFVKGTLRP